MPAMEKPVEANKEKEDLINIWTPLPSYTMEPATILAKAEGYDVVRLHKQVLGYLKALLGFINGK